jgi:hypothetical protein
MGLTQGRPERIVGRGGDLPIQRQPSYLPFLLETQGMRNVSLSPGRSSTHSPGQPLSPIHSSTEKLHPLPRTASLSHPSLYREAPPTPQDSLSLPSIPLQRSSPEASELSTLGEAQAVPENRYKAINKHSKDSWEFKNITLNKKIFIMLMLVIFGKT